MMVMKLNFLVFHNYWNIIGHLFCKIENLLKFKNSCNKCAEAHFLLNMVLIRVFLFLIITTELVEQFMLGSEEGI